MAAAHQVLQSRLRPVTGQQQQQQQQQQLVVVPHQPVLLSMAKAMATLIWTHVSSSSSRQQP
jgi:hypothetical protein